MLRKIVRSHIHDFQEEAKCICVDRNQDIGCVRVGIDWKGRGMRELRGDGNVPYPIRIMVYMGVYICQNFLKLYM